ncbi:MAG: hypothetical protein V7L05_20425 [Nostoc sp.]|uniref:hypothetical protein n=1 Tax=Nostoc sp. TaxID=1180 RepID=UPI002FFB8C02
MAGIGEIINLAGDVAGVVNTVTKAVSGSGKGPVRGARLEYDIPALGGRLLLKEPFGFWFGLTPIYPIYGIFKGTNKFTVGKKFTKRAGFRFKSYTILLKAGTKIKVPKDKASEQRSGANNGTDSRQLGSISIGVSENVAVHEFIDFLKSSKQSANINGVISPTLRKYQWAGALHRASNSIIPGLPTLNPGDIADIAGIIEGVAGLL